MPSERLQVILELITGNYKREAHAAATATGEIGRSAQTASTGMGTLNKVWKNFAGPAAIIGAGVAVADFARDSIMAASDLEESINAVNVVFGEAAGAIHDFGKTSVDSVGLASVNVNKAATVIGSALLNMGFDADTAAQKTLDLTTRAADMASVFNTTVPEALGAIQSALRGETDPIEKFGVSLTAAAVDAEAAALGYKRVAGQFDVTAKGAARMSLIMQQTERVSGDFANTADSTANTMKRLNERFLETKARVGQALMPVFTALLDVADKLGPVFEDVALEIADAVTALAPLLDGLGWLVDRYSDLKGGLDAAEDSDNRFLEFLGKAGNAAFGFGGGLGAVIKGIEDLLPPTKEATDKLEDFQVAADNQDTLETSRYWIDRNAGAMGYMADAAKEAVPAIWLMRDAQRDARDATKAHDDALRQLTSRLLAQLNPALAAYQALQDLEEAQKDAAEATAEFGAESEEADAALLRMAIATGEAQAALNNFGDTEGAVRAFAEIMKVSADEAARVLINLGLITEKDWKATLIIGIRTEGDLRALERGVIPEGQGVPSPTTATTTTLGGRPRALGGPVAANQMYLVGERGPEMFVSGSSGSIIPNGALSRTVNISVQSPMDDFRSDLQYASVVASLVTYVEGM